MPNHYFIFIIKYLVKLTVVFCAVYPLPSTHYPSTHVGSDWVTWSSLSSLQILYRIDPPLFNNCLQVRLYLKNNLFQSLWTSSIQLDCLAPVSDLYSPYKLHHGGSTRMVPQHVHATRLVKFEDESMSSKVPSNVNRYFLDLSSPLRYLPRWRKLRSRSTSPRSMVDYFRPSIIFFNLHRCAGSEGEYRAYVR